MTQPLTTARPTFEELYAEHYDAFVRFAEARTWGILEEDARDIVSDAWVRIYETLPEWQDRGVPIGAWLYRVLRNIIIDRLRAIQGKRATVSLDLDLHDVPDVAIDSEVLGIVSDEVMASIIDALDEKQAHLITLVYIKGWRLTDVAQEYSESLDAIKKFHRRTLGRIRTFLETGATRRKRRSRSA